MTSIQVESTFPQHWELACHPWSTDPPDRPTAKNTQRNQWGFVYHWRLVQ